MKNQFLLLLFLGFIVSSCQKQKEFSLSSEYPNKALNATMLLQNDKDSIINSGNFENGKIVLKGPFLAEGFHKILVQFDDENKTKTIFPIWLSEDSLHISFKEDLESYPTITTNNAIQKDLNSFYEIEESLSLEANKRLKKAVEKEKNAGIEIRGEAYNKLLYDVDVVKEEIEKNYFKSIEEFSKKNPAPIVLFNVIKESSEEKISQHSNEFYTILKNVEKELSENKEFTDFLAELDKKSKIAIGKKIELKIFGVDLKGKVFDPLLLKGKKLILLEFWKSTNQLGRSFRPAYLNTYEIYKSKGFEIIGICLDDKADFWKTAAKDDKVTWPQFSDLKGVNSPNLEYYNIESVPKNILMDTEGNIIEVDLPAQSLELEIQQFLKKSK